MIASVSCAFEFSEEDWNTIWDEQTRSLIIPRNVALHLCAMVISTSRGVIHGKTEQMLFNNIFLPLIDVTDIIKSDVIMESKPSN